MKIWTCGSSPWSGSRNAWTWIKNANGASRLSNLGFFSARSKWFPVGRDWWPWTKPGYITTTWKQSNNQWSGGIAAHPAPPQKNSECKNPLENFSPRFFFGIKTASSSLIIFQRVKLSTQSITHLCWLVQLKGILKEKRLGNFTKGVLFLRNNTRLTGHLQQRRNWPTWASSFLITHPILRIWPRRTTTCSLDWKKQLKVLICIMTVKQWFLLTCYFINYRMSLWLHVSVIVWPSSGQQELSCTCSYCASMFFRET